MPPLRCSPPAPHQTTQRNKNKIINTKDYLESKRLSFPRFYFVAPADLLDILSKGSNPQAILRHLSKCFDNVHNLSFRLDAAGAPTKVCCDWGQSVHTAQAMHGHTTIHRCCACLAAVLLSCVHTLAPASPIALLHHITPHRTTHIHSLDVLNTGCDGHV